MKPKLDDLDLMLMNHKNKKMSTLDKLSKSKTV